MDVIKVVMALKLFMVQQSLAQEIGMQRIVEGPENQTVILGQTIRLRCRVEFQQGPVTWTKRGFLLGTGRSLPAYPRYAMVGSSAEGEYHLEIKDVQLVDEDTYQCQISATAKQPVQTSKTVKLTVLVPPSSPRFFNDFRQITGREGSSLSTKCVVQGGKPAAKIEWFLANDENGSSIIRQLDRDISPDVINRGDLFDVESTIRIVAQSDDDGKYLVCLARHDAIEKPMIVSAQWKVRGKPKVTLKLNSSETLKENGVATLLCHVDANAGESADLQYRWFHNGKELIGTNSATLTLPNLNRSVHHKSFYECKVSNDAGEGVSKYEMEILFAPYFKSNAQNLVVQEGETVTFTCLADSNPTPKQIKWTKIGHSSWPETFGNNLTIQKVTYHHEGKYNCSVYSEGFQPVFQIFSLHIKGYPRVEISNTPGAVEGSSAKIHCKITGYPKPPENNITWYKGGSILNPALNHRYDISVVRPNEDEMFSVLTITKAFGADFDTYNCSAVNEIGGAWDQTKLVESSSFPLYVMIPGVVGGCVAILIIAMAIVWANRKYLCHSKSSTHSDDHSDVMVKVEALDANGIPLHYFPDMYNSGPPDGVDLLYNNKDYVSVPQDNPDFDLLPPPYPSYHMPSSTFSNGGTMNNGMTQQNGHLVHVTYIDDSMHPRNVVHHLSTPVSLMDNVISSPNGGYSCYSSPHFNLDSNTIYHPFTGYGDQTPYYPSGVHQLPLEPVQEVPTPDTVDEQNGNISNLPRCPSQISTHV